MRSSSIPLDQPDPSYKPGTIIRLRSRLWRVDDIQKDILTATSIDGLPVERRRFFLPFESVTPGQLEPPNPDILGNYSTQDLLLRAYRLSMIHGTAPLLSLQRSRVIPQNYQLVPVVMALEMPKVRMLIADDVGLGKTIEAGLIITELLARQRASRLLVICPANLREQWREALDYFFHIDAKVISTRHKREMERELPPGANPWEYYPYLITSMDYAKLPETKTQILDVNWDIVLIDEAHNVAKPHQVAPDQKIEMDRWELAEAISKKSQHLLLLTATPHNGYSDTYASLIRMLNVDAVSGSPYAPLIHKEIAKNYVCQRRRKDVEEWFKKESDEKSPFPERDQSEVFVSLSKEHARAIQSVEDLSTHILDTVKGETAYRKRIARWTVMHFHKRALSSPLALVRSLNNRLNKRRERRGEEDTEDDAGIPESSARATVLDEDPGEKFTDEEATQRIERPRFGNERAQEKEEELLKKALEIAQEVTPSKDYKLQQLLQSTLLDRLQTSPKVIIFTKYYDTLEYLQRNIAAYSRYQGVQIITLDGTLNETQRREKFVQFEKARKAIMIATDCISEGINLQHVCSQMIHYELPWNPNRLEQRTGRIDRYGQKDPKVHIRTMVVRDTMDAAILKVLIEKAQKIRDDYGFSPPFFGDDFSVIDLIREQGLKVNICQKTLDEFEEKSFAKYEIEDPFSKETLDKIKSECFYGQTEVELKEVQKRLKETETLIGSQEQIQDFVRSALNRFNCTFSQNPDNTFKVEISNDLLLEPGIPSVIESATFDPMIARDDPTVMVIDLGHPLVRKLIELVKQQTFTDASIYGRTAAMKTKNIEKVTAVYHYLSRYVVQTKPVSIIEELLSVAIEGHSDKVFSKEQTQQLLSSSPEPDNRRANEIIEDIKEALGKKDLSRFVKQKAEERCQELINERRKMKKDLESRGEQQWLEGIEDLSMGSLDLLTITLFYPSVRGG